MDEQKGNDSNMSVGEMTRHFCGNGGLYAGICLAQGTPQEQVSTASSIQSLITRFGSLLKAKTSKFPEGFTVIRKRRDQLEKLARMCKECTFTFHYGHVMDPLAVHINNGGFIGEQAFAVTIRDKDGNETTVPVAGAARLFPGDAAAVRDGIVKSIPKDAHAVEGEAVVCIFFAKDRDTKLRIMRQYVSGKPVTLGNYAGNGHLVGNDPTLAEVVSKLQAVFNPEPGAMDADTLEGAWVAKMLATYLELCHWIVGEGGLSPDKLGWARLGDNAHDDLTAATLETVRELPDGTPSMPIDMFRKDKKGSLYRPEQLTEGQLKRLTTFEGLAIGPLTLMCDGTLPKPKGAYPFLVVLDKEGVEKTVAFYVWVPPTMSLDDVNEYLSLAVPTNGGFSGLGKARDIIQHLFDHGDIPEGVTVEQAVAAITNGIARMRRVVQNGAMGQCAAL